METIQTKLKAVDWSVAGEELNEKGFAIVSKIISPGQCAELIRNYDSKKIYRKTISMERYRFGAGEYKYFNYPLPGLIQTIREIVYGHLSPIANDWMKVLKIGRQFPETFPAWQ